MIGAKHAAIAAGIALVAVGAAAPFTDLPVRGIGNVPDVLSMLHKRSPQERPDGALVATKSPVSAKLPVAVTTAAAPKVPDATAPAAKPAVVQYVVPETPLAMPAAVVPAVATALPLAAAPAAAAAGGGLFIPPLVIPGGGGGGTTTLVTPPSGGNPTPVPGVPEPGTWAMMIIGFGMLGGLLRRRRRTTSENDVARPDYAALRR
jgi:hypothetical protein